MPVVVATGYSSADDPAHGTAVAARQVREGLGGARCDLAIVFLAGDHVTAPATVLAAIHDELEPGELVGCATGGLIAGGQEHEQGSGIAIWAIDVGDGAVDVFELRTRPVQDGLALLGLPEAEAGSSAIVLLADSSHLPLEGTLRAFEEHLPGVPLIGGVPSMVPPDGRPLLRGRGATDAAAIGIRFSGVEVLPCVSQGARPIGPELAVTAGEGGVIRELAGRPAIEALRDTVDALGSADQERIRHGLLLGLVVGPGRPEYGSGDFVVRGLAGADPEAGAVVVGAPVEVGQVTQLHVRDPETASRDFEDALRLRRAAVGSGQVAGALAFTCNGRGHDMFGHDHHDADAIQRELGPLPLAGMFSAGEIGPVGGRPFVHGFTATVAVFLA
ncbi:FIST signal transduction protein [Patulibacter defluvii]|uniref:FIST signal transduction protein n=1 Tax=Patulibacter defluvii TaxID=3095358 RepID=UPI002A7570C8|nr:FIST N-terminal domain-containing protein [Patulibacter sp. DM4]